MSTLTKQWLQQKIADMEATRDEIPFGLDEDDSNTLAALRIALASLEAEAVCVIDQSNLDYLKSGADADVWPASRAEMGDVLLYRYATPAPANAEPVAWLWSHRKHPSEVSIVRPEDDERAEGAHWSGWSCQALYAAPPAPASVPDEDLLHMAASAIEDLLSNKDRYCAEVWADIPAKLRRAAMLQGAEPASNRDELPLDYLQGHKDGLEWAAQLAEANHPQTGDWLYDDPIDLARAIRKGPDMPTAQAGNHTEQHLDMVDHSGDANKMVAGNSPLVPDGWVACSERMPDKGQNVLISVNFDSPLIEPLICSARYTGSTFRRGDVTVKPGEGVEEVTHWMPLPAAPQQEA
ncbi:DUF551 domain-containing protein [Enterobacter roggenkampii]|uniref:DUF551 domain-containing protein n=1 Tax=Enterobacter roggenkampii TaxID=1812935 RepID=UPI002032E1A8|nr:DUF551 domain-containing protein [Enterobacter roggenkampii]